MTMSGFRARISATPRPIKPNAPRTRRIESWISPGPSIETITSSKNLETSSARLTNSNPVVKRVRRMFCSRKNWQRASRSLCNRGSPPVNTTCRTPRLRNDARWRSRSAARTCSCVSRFQISHMTQRQLQLLCTFRMRIGMCVSAEASSPDAETLSSCIRGMTHSLSADRKITAQNPFGLRDELFHRGAYPPPLTLHLEELQSVLESIGKTLEEGWACQHNPAGKHDQLNLCHVQLPQHLSWTQPAIADHQYIRNGTRRELTFSSPQAQYICRTIGDHVIDRRVVQAKVGPRKTNLIQQVT